MIGLIKRRQLSKQFIPFRCRCSNWGCWGGISPVWGLSRSPGWSWRPRNGAHMQSTHLRLTLTHFKLTVHRQSVGRAFSLEFINALCRRPNFQNYLQSSHVTLSCLTHLSGKFCLKYLWSCLAMGRAVRQSQLWGRQILETVTAPNYRHTPPLAVLISDFSR